MALQKCCLSYYSTEDNFKLWLLAQIWSFSQMAGIGRGAGVLIKFLKKLLSHNPVVIIVFIREGKHVVVNEFSPHLFPIRCKKPSCGVVLSLHRWEPSLIPQKQMSVLSTITTMYVHVKLLKPKFVIRVYHLAQSNWIFSLHKYYWSVIYNSNK